MDAAAGIIGPAGRAPVPRRRREPRPAGGRSDPGADRGAAEVDLAQERRELAEARDVLLDGGGEAGELHAERIGTASCSWVRPTLTTGANARPRSAKASASRRCSARSGAQASSTARRIAVG